MAWTVSDSAKELRPAECRDTDIAALRAIAQATVNVELFTVPLYMGTLYSIQGMHQITGKDEDFYKGRLWPGPATTAEPNTPNEEAFNIIFSVFIEEMLHIQMAANIAGALGVIPTFTSPALQNPDDHSWECYGPDKTIIPHIVDLRDTRDYSEITVNIAELSENQVKLFMAIEEPAETAREQIPQDFEKYFPTVPFEGWTPENTEEDLPMFGTIGWMYQCYYDYMNLRYEDEPNKRLWNYAFTSGSLNSRYGDAEKLLWDYVFTFGSRQNDLFNISKKSHPRREFCGFETTVTGIGIDPTNSDEAFARAVAMMDAITNQGEGSLLTKKEKERLARLAVEPTYQASYEALKADYPRYTDTGELAESADAEARFTHGEKDHYERFKDRLGKLVKEKKVVTWPQWHKDRKKEGHRPWRADDLQTSVQTLEADLYELPSAEAIAEAMNRIGDPRKANGEPDEKTFKENHKTFSKVAVGSIAGITTVLNDYWNPDPKYDKVSFPYPSMVGSGDRMSICWALFGKAPDLSKGVKLPSGACPIRHACQHLDFNTRDSAGKPTPATNECAQVEVFHTCRGSNACKAQGGCGFVQSVTGGSGCGFALVAAKTDEGDTADNIPFSPFFSARVCGTVVGPDLFSAPGDNKCGGFGGCAVPISASQIMPRGGQMKLFHFNNEKCNSVPDPMDFTWERGEKVYEVAYRAYKRVMDNYYLKDGREVPEQPPPPSDQRLVFPPST